MYMQLLFGIEFCMSAVKVKISITKIGYNVYNQLIHFEMF